VGFILSVDLQKGGVIGEFEVIPIIVDDDFVPRPGEGTEGENIRAFITGDIATGRRRRDHLGTLV